MTVDVRAVLRKDEIRFFVEYIGKNHKALITDFDDGQLPIHWITVREAIKSAIGDNIRSLN